jgi:predicted PurR-regulated permease PerM
MNGVPSVDDTSNDQKTDHFLADQGHHRRVARPHRESEGPVAAAEESAARMRSGGRAFGPRGQRFDWRSPFFLGLAASAGVAVTYGAIHLLGSASTALALVFAALFFALGLEPAVSALVNRKMPRWAAVTIVLVVVFAVIAGSIAAVIPPLVEQARQFIEQAPHYVQEAQNHSSVIGRLNDRFHVQQRIADALNSVGTPALGSAVKVGKTVAGVASHVGIVAVMTVYFLAGLPAIRATFYRFIPKSRRPRAILIGDEVFAKFGDYLYGNVLTSVIAGAATSAWCVIFHIPYALLLGVFVAILDLFPYGSSIAGTIVALVALTVSIPIAIATVAFYVVFRLAEDYLLTPKIIGRAVKVSGGATVVAVLIGAELMGVIGALAAIPIAAALQLLVQELVFPAIDEA